MKPSCAEWRHRSSEDAWGWAFAPIGRVTAASAIDRLFCTKQPAARQGTGGFELHQRDPACFAARLRRVLYVDGESRQAKCNRGLPLVGGLEPEAAPDYFRMLSADASARGLPDLATSEGQRIFGVSKKQRDHTMNEIKIRRSFCTSLMTRPRLSRRRPCCAKHAAKRVSRSCPFRRSAF